MAEEAIPGSDPRAEFDESYERLRHAANRHARIRQETSDYHTLNASRSELDRARSANASHRRRIVRRRDYAIPDAVPAGLGRGGLAGRAKWATVVAALVFLVAVGLGATVAIQATRGGPLVVRGEIVETIGDDCRWQVSVPLVSTGDEALVIMSLGVLIDARPIALWVRPPSGGDALLPGASTEISFERRVSPCPVTPEDVEHGELRATWLYADSPALDHLAARAEEGRMRRGEAELMRHRF